MSKSALIPKLIKAANTVPAMVAKPPVITAWISDLKIWPKPSKIFTTSHKTFHKKQSWLEILQFSHFRFVWILPKLSHFTTQTTVVGYLLHIFSFTQLFGDTNWKKNIFFPEMHLQMLLSTSSLLIFLCCISGSVPEYEDQSSGRTFIILLIWCLWHWHHSDV